MAYNTKTFMIKADSSKGVFIDNDSTGINEDTNYVAKIPDLWYKDSFELIIDAYEEFDARTFHDFGSVVTAKLYLKQKNSLASAITLDASGVVTQGDIPSAHDESSSSTESDSSEEAYYRIIFTVPAETISNGASYLAGEDCLLWAEVTSSGEQTTFAQEMKVIDEYGTLPATARYATSDFPVDGWELTTSQTVTAYPGRVVYVATVDSLTIALPSASIYPVQELEIVNAGSDQLTVSGLTGGDAYVEADETGHFIAIGGYWYQATYPIADD